MPSLPLGFRFQFSIHSIPEYVMFLHDFRRRWDSKRRPFNSRLGRAPDLCESRMLLSAHVAAAISSAHAGRHANPQLVPEDFSGSWSLGGPTNMHLTQNGEKITGGFSTPGVVGVELKLKGSVNGDNLIATAKGRYTDSGLGTGKAKFSFNVNLVTNTSFTGTVQLVFKGNNTPPQPINGTKFVP